MKVFTRWERELGFFILPSLSVDTYNSANFGDEWPMVFGITFCWMKLVVEFEFPISRRDGETGNREEDRTGSPEQEDLNDLITDSMIMHVLNGIGYEERSWIPVVRRHLAEVCLPNLTREEPFQEIS